MSLYARVLLVLMIVYASFLGGFLYFLPDLVYPFAEAGGRPADLPRSEVKFLPPTGAGDPRLEVWVAEPLPGEPVVLYFMGFAGALSIHEPRLRAFAEAGYGVAAMAYRGGGGQAGEPSEAALLTDAFRLYDGLDDLFAEPVAPEDRVIYGFSLGSGLAVPLAAEREEFALILEAPFDRMCRTFEQRLPLVLPACGLMREHRFDSVERIGAAGTVAYFLHGAEDQVVPLALGRALFAATPQPRFARIYPRGGHEDLPRFGAEADTIRFIDTLRGKP